MAKELTLLQEKMDQLMAQVVVLTEMAEGQKRRSQDLEELKNDLIPIGNQLIQLTINELEEIGTEFELEDLLYLLKRLLRNTQLILSLLDRFEALMDIADEVELLGKQVFSATVEALDRLERNGFFDQTRSLIDTVTQTDTLVDLNLALEAFTMPETTERPPSLWKLIREIFRPETRRGLFRLIRVVQALGVQSQDN
jgi:hypothetical protein